MRRFTILELTILGLLAGVVISVYVVFLESMGWYMSPIISGISLRPLIDAIQAPSTISLYVEFACMVAVYMCYGAIVGFLFKRYEKSPYIIIPAIVILVALIGWQQATGVAQPSSADMPVLPYSTIINTVRTTAPSTQNQQYFGNEVVGDLTGLGSKDVAFIVIRDDPDRGRLYYLLAALVTPEGHAGTNILYLGDKAVPQAISIIDGIIDVSYAISGSKASTTIEHFYAHITDGALEEIATTKNRQVYFGALGLQEQTVTFAPCSMGSMLSIATTSAAEASSSSATGESAASTTIVQYLHDQIVQISSLNGSSLPVFGVLLGTATTSATQDGASSTISAISGSFSLKSVLAVLPKGVCP
jgi:hypothetical protein